MWKNQTFLGRMMNDFTISMFWTIYRTKNKYITLFTSEQIISGKCKQYISIHCTSEIDQGKYL